MRLTCHDCGSTIYISAEAPNCPECGAELESYLRALDYIRECYRQASEETLAGDNERALAILAQGLSAVNASELHLLAALIHRKQGEYDGMRHHVAAIPVDDPLRPEGEWLLRSHQQKQRAVRQAQKEYSPPAQVGKAVRQLSPEFYSISPAVDSPMRPRRASALRPGRILVPLAFLMVAALFLRQPLSSGWAFLTTRPTAPVAAQVEPTPPITPATESNAAAAAPATPTSEPIPTPIPLPTATPPVPVVVVPQTQTVAAPGEIQPVAAVSEALTAALATSEANQFDLAGYLAQVDRGDLAVLPINAALQDGRLLLSGVVTLTSQRLELLALAAEIPGVVDVDAINLVVRLPEVYTVGDGDTLWTIAYYLYGDGTRWEELYETNAELLGNTILLDVGMELLVPER